MPVWDHVQLFTAAGILVDTVKVQLTDGRYPKILVANGRHFILENGRYVEATPTMGTPV